MTSLVSPTFGRPAVAAAEAGSMTLPAPSKTNNAASALSQEVAACGGNTQLMEARLCELTSSIRALLRSNTDLEGALSAHGGNEDDPDFLQALEENKIVVRRQGRVAAALVQELKNHGCNISLEADLQQALLDISTVVMAENGGGEVEGRNGALSSETNTTAGAPAVSGIFL